MREREREYVIQGDVDIDGVGAEGGDPGRRENINKCVPRLVLPGNSPYFPTIRFDNEDRTKVGADRVGTRPRSMG